MLTTEQHLDRLWAEIQDAGGSGDEVDRRAFDRVMQPLVQCLRRIAEGGMFSETACIVAARKVLKLHDDRGGAA